jgi:uncharacterized SAM-binding protein YcdF (DUF218 family)
VHHLAAVLVSGYSVRFAALIIIIIIIIIIISCGCCGGAFLVSLVVDKLSNLLSSG